MALMPGTITSWWAAMKLSPSQARPKMPITATTPARSVAVLGISSTFTFVAASITAATASMTISITSGMARGAVGPGRRRGGLGAGGGRRDAAALHASLLLGVVLEILAEKHRDARRHDDTEQGGR